MKTKKLSFLINLLMLFSITSLFAQLPNPPSGHQWEVVEEDNFDGSTLNTNMWGYGSTPWDSENQSSCTWIAPEDTYLNGSGSLVLRSRSGSFTAPSGTVFPYTSGWAWTKEWRTYGYLEIRASYPNNRGTWPAFWMLQDGWPPEIDIAEYRGNPKGYLTQAFYDGSWSSATQGGDYTGWHNYGLEWSEGSLKWYVDGNLVHSYTGSTVPSSPMYVILSAGTDCNDTDGSGFPNYFNIDYFRWYQSKPNTNGNLNGNYRIVNRNSGKCLSPLNDSTADATQVVQYTINNTSNEIWTVNEISSGVYNIIHQSSGKYADINGASTSAGANNIIWPNNGGNNQKWNIINQGDGYYSIVNVNSGLLLDINGASSADNANNIQWTDNGGYNQDWSFVSVSSAKNSAQKKTNSNRPEETYAKVILFPNPVGDELNLALSETFKEKAEITIYNVLGHEVFKTNHSSSNTKKISTKNFSNGIYFIKISNGIDSKTLKLIKK